MILALLSILAKPAYFRPCTPPARPRPTCGLREQPWRTTSHPAAEQRWGRRRPPAPRRPSDEIICFKSSKEMPPRLNIDAAVTEGCSAAATSPPMAHRIGHGLAASDCAAHKASCNTYSSGTHLHASTKLYSDKCITAACEIVAASSRMEGIGGGVECHFRHGEHAKAREGCAGSHE